jgi:hypothetical protein
MNSKWTELQFYNSRIRLSYDKTVPRETELGKKKFCLQITTAQIGLTTQVSQNRGKKKNVLPSDNNSPSRTDYPSETEQGEKNCFAFR